MVSKKTEMSNWFTIDSYAQSLLQLFLLLPSIDQRVKGPEIKVLPNNPKLEFYLFSAELFVSRRII